MGHRDSCELQALAHAAVHICSSLQGQKLIQRVCHEREQSFSEWRQRSLHILLLTGGVHAEATQSGRHAPLLFGMDVINVAGM